MARAANAFRNGTMKRKAATAAGGYLAKIIAE